MKHMRKLLLIAAIAVPAGAASAQTVGNVGAFNAAATGAPPGAGARTLSLGGDVVQNERLQTDAQGTAQIVFLDKSALNVGRNSSIIVDRFVYDPGRGAGAMTTSLTRGALRYVGGQVSHTTGAVIETPSASIGVRGGIVTVLYEGGQLRVISGYGTTTISNAAGSQVLRRPGFEVIVPGAGSPPSPPQPLDPAALASIEKRFLSAHGQKGGARIPPTDAGAARAGVGSHRPDPASPNGALPGLDGGLAQQYSTTRNLGSTPLIPRCRPRSTPGLGPGQICD